MKYAREFLKISLVGGLAVLLPVYLALLLLLKGMQTTATFVAPVTALLPSWLPAQNLVSLLALLITCFVVGLAVRTRMGRAVRQRLEKSFFSRIPGYAMFRSLTLRLAGSGDESKWQPALVELEDALVPAFVIEEHDDGQFTVFVPSVPTPLAGAVYVLPPDRVHVVDVPFTEAVKSISRWGVGQKNLVAAMRPRDS